MIAKKLILCLSTVVDFVFFSFHKINIPTIYATSRKKDPMPRCTIYKHDSDKNKKCPSVDIFILQTVLEAPYFEDFRHLS